MTDDCSKVDVPWARSAPARALRELVLVALLGPTMDLYTRRRIRGREHLDRLEGPVVFVANHSSHMDTPTILRALPKRWRRRTVVAAATDYFYRKREIAYAVSMLFNTVPVERNGGGLDPGSNSLLGRLIDEDWSLLIFAEGTRSRDGTVGRLRSGAAVLAADHDLAIVPVYVAGTNAVMPPGRRWMRRRPGRHVWHRHPIEVCFGIPIRHRVGEHRTDMMESVRRSFAAAGATTGPVKEPAVKRSASA